MINREEVQVSFRENAKQCILSTESPSGFQEVKLKAGESCYVSDSLPRGKTASLYWKEPGVFKYTLEYARPASRGHLGGTKRPAVGVIEIK